MDEVDERAGVSSNNCSQPCLIELTGSALHAEADVCLLFVWYNSKMLHLSHPKGKPSKEEGAPVCAYRQQFPQNKKNVKKYTIQEHPVLVL